MLTPPSSDVNTGLSSGRRRPRLLLLLAGLALIVFGWSPWQADPVGAGEPVPMSNDTCLACHKNQQMEMRLSSGEMMSVSVDPAAFAKSVHGTRLTCFACHGTITGYPHPKQEAATKRGYSLAQYETCKSCHFANYTKTLDSVHFGQLSTGHSEAPVCTDCHGAHNVMSPDEPRSKISRTCASCHPTRYADYVDSVHGKALVEENNEDVPSCTSCHGVHNIQDPTTAQFRVAEPELCAKCHTDEKIMSKYGLSTNVLKTYLADFHGTTVSLYEKQSPGKRVYKAVCTDCHGIHDIKSPSDPESSVIKANLVDTCRQCHADATDNFPTSWLMHYEPSPQNFPLVYYVKMFYWVFIPLTVIGTVLHVGMDFLRTMRNRRKQ